LSAGKAVELVQSSVTSSDASSDASSVASKSAGAVVAARVAGDNTSVDSTSRLVGNVSSVVTKTATYAPHPGDNATLAKNASNPGVPPKTAKSSILLKLLAAKGSSDNRDYAKKHSIMRELMTQRPADFEREPPEKGIQGITHKPTGFRLHLPQRVVP